MKLMPFQLTNTDEHSTVSAVHFGCISFRRRRGKLLRIPLLSTRWRYANLFHASLVSLRDESCANLTGDWVGPGVVKRVTSYLPQAGIESRSSSP